MCSCFDVNKEWYFKFRACIMCKGDRYLDLVAAVEDPAQGTMDTMLWDLEQVQILRHLYLVLVMLTEDAALTQKNAGKIERSVTV